MHPAWRLGVLATLLGCTPTEPTTATPRTEPSPSTPSLEPKPEPDPEPDEAEMVARSPASAASRPTDPSWQEVEIADDCTIRIARAPTAVELPVVWTPCAEGSEGCLETTTELPDAGPFSAYRLQAFVLGSGIHTVVRSPLPGPLTRVAVGPLDGPPFLAVELAEREGCSLGQIALGESGGIVEVTYDAADGYASRAYLQGPLHDAPGWRTVAARMLRRDHPRFIGESVALVGDRPFVLASGGPLLRPGAEADRWVEVAGSRQGWTCCMETSGEVITLLRESIPEAVVGSRLGADMVPLLEPARGEGTSTIRFDGTTAVWVQGSGRDGNNLYRRVELWTGRLDPTPAIVDRRMVAELRGDWVSPPTVGRGVALVWEHDPKTGARQPVLIGLAHGERRELPPMELRRVLWLTDRELAVELGPSGNIIGPVPLRRLPL